ncbi:hypothetical protein OG496_00475 [Streptomyces sp. NBC_00988]|nr:hypothetical protein OG496_00475 [Streptomyces sp. NBC_00988]
MPIIILAVLLSPALARLLATTVAVLARDPIRRTDARHALRLLLTRK